MPTVALLGDSILDNGSYTRPGPDTAACLRELLGRGWRVDLLARDGATIADVHDQLGGLDGDADVAVLSVGGNDALGHIDLLTEPATSTAEVLVALEEVLQPFAEAYQQLVATLRPWVRRLVVCTIYEVPLDDPRLARLVKVALALFNDRIIRAAGHLKADVIDIRSVCTGPADFVLQIEPSEIGARKIAEAIHRALARDQPNASVRLFSR